MKVSILSRSEAKTVLIGKKIGKVLEPGDTVFLSGDLGCGKTTITRGICRGLGVDENIPIRSPSFTMIHEYEAKLHIRHADLYRAEGYEELESLGIFDPAYTGVTIIEWAERLGNDIAKPSIWITMEDVSDSDRKITFNGADGLLEKFEFFF